MKNKNKTAYIIFFIGYFCLLITDTCKKIDLIYINEKYITAFGYILIGISIMSNFKKYKNIEKKNVLVFIVATIAAIVSWRITNNFTVLRLLLLLVAVYTINFEDFMKVDLIMKTILTVTLVILPIMGVIENNILLRKDLSVRYSFGFNHPNSLSIYMIMIIFEAYYLMKKKNNKKICNFIMYMITPIFILVIYFVANSRMSALSLIIFFVLNNFSKFIRCKKQRKDNSIIVKLIINAFGVFTVCTISTIALACINENILINIDKLFSNRYTNYIKFIEKFGISLLGTEVPIQLGYGEYLDNMYLKLLVNQGVIQYLLYYLVSFKSLKKSYLNKDYIYILIYFVILIEGFTETNMIMPTVNIFLLYWLAGKYEEDLKKDIKDFSEEEKDSTYKMNIERRKIL